MMACATGPQGCRRRRGVPIAAAVVAAQLAVGCVVGPNFKPEPPPPADRLPTLPPVGALSGAAVAGRQAGTGPVPRRWWTGFGSSRIDDMEDEAIRANPTLRAARAALGQARELFLAQRATLAPTVGATFDATRARNSATIAPPLSSNAQTYSLLTGQFTIAYVVDVFGGARRGVEAARAAALILDDEREAAYLTLTANVAAGAVQLASLLDQLAEAERVIADDRRSVAITADMLRLGESSDSDLASAQVGLEQAEQAAPVLRRLIDQQRDLLGALLGRSPGEAQDIALSLQDLRLPANPPASLPSELIRQRPDIRAAEAAVHAASASVGVALAARFPSLTLGGDGGAAASSLPGLVSSSNALWSTGLGATQTLFDAGALRHRQKAAEAALEQAKALYRVAVLAGLQNTADVMQAVVEDAAAARHAAAGAEAAARSRNIARAQFDQGQAGALALLVADAAAAQARILVIQAAAARYTDAVALYQALGGGWRGDS